VSHLRIVLVAACLATLPGCYTIRMEVSHTPTTAPPIEDWHGYWFWGLTSADIDMSKICPAGTVAIEEDQTFLDGLIGQLTIGIFQPRSQRYWCRSTP
jgi:hypothetical protein